MAAIAAAAEVSGLLKEIGFLADQREAVKSGDPARILEAAAWLPWTVEGPNGQRTAACRCRFCGAWDTVLRRPLAERRHELDCYLNQATDELLRLRRMRDVAGREGWATAWANDVRWYRGIIALADSLVEAKDAYIAVLEAEMHGLLGLATVHGWKSANVEVGEQARVAIAQAAEIYQRRRGERPE